MQPTVLSVIHRNQLMRECLASALSERELLRVVEFEHTRADIVEAIKRAAARVVLLDLEIADPHAAELTYRIRQADVARVLLLASAHSAQRVGACVEAGAHGCVLENSSIDDLIGAVKRVSRGETFCSPEVVEALFAELSSSPRSLAGPILPAVKLTPREREVLELIRDGLSNKQIAHQLDVSVYTVKNHVHHVLEKLHATDRSQAVELARQWLHE